MLFISLVGIVVIVAGYVTLMALAYRGEDQEFRHPESHHHGSAWLPASSIHRVDVPPGSTFELDVRKDEVTGEDLVHV